jgi:hypothetical protein
MTDLSLRIITPEARLAFPSQFRSTAPPAEGRDSRYQCELIFAPDSDLSELMEVADLAARNRWGEWLPDNIRSPFRDGDTDRQGVDGYSGCTFISCRSKDIPGIATTPDQLPGDDEDAIYDGCYVKASVTAFTYDFDGNKGVSFALNNVWKLADGQPFASQILAADDIATIETGQTAGSVP